MTRSAIEGPSYFHLAMEGRVFAESAAFFSALAWLPSLPAGDGHPVMLLPGFMGADSSTAALRFALGRLGYAVYGWGGGRNEGAGDALDHVGRRLLRLLRDHDRGVSLIGQSLGGIYAREMGRTYPHAVRTVVTLGSPFRFRSVFGHTNNVASMEGTRMVAPHHGVEEDQRRQIDVPTTAIYSRSDGVVNWQACLQPEGPWHENIEVIGSHSGMAHHPAVLFAVTDRLAQPVTSWAPFRAPKSLSFLYPMPALS